MSKKGVSIKILLFTLFLGLCVSCASNPAPIVMKGHIDYSRKSYLAKYNDDSSMYVSKNILSSSRSLDMDEDKGFEAKELTTSSSSKDLTVKNSYSKNTTQDLTSKKTVSRSEVVKSRVNKNSVVASSSKTVSIKSASKSSNSNSVEQSQPKKQLASNNQTKQIDTTRAVIVKDKVAPKISKNQALNKSSNKFMWPVRGKVISKFGPKGNDIYNDGINIKASKNTPFKAAEDGVVMYCGSELKNHGNLILIKHSNNWFSAYAHSNSVEVEKGDIVAKGQVIGYVGNTGNVETPQLYFGLRKGKKPVNPESFLR